VKVGKKGFTLIEVVIALSIIAGAVIVVGNTWSGNLLRVRKAKFYNNVALLLERKMTEIEAKYGESPLEEIPEEENGDFGSDFKQYRWKLTSQEFEMPDLSSALVGREGGADDTLISMIRQMSDYISQSVKEVTVTVFVKSKKTEVSFSITTYFIDFNKQLPLGPGTTGSGP
jgi:general secretion pathway protein I